MPVLSFFRLVLGALTGFLLSRFYLYIINNPIYYKISIVRLTKRAKSRYKLKIILIPTIIITIETLGFFSAVLFYKKLKYIIIAEDQLTRALDVLKLYFGERAFIDLGTSIIRLVSKKKVLLLSNSRYFLYNRLKSKSFLISIRYFCQIFIFFYRVKYFINL